MRRRGLLYDDAAELADVTEGMTVNHDVAPSGTWTPPGNLASYTFKCTIDWTTSANGFILEVGGGGGGIGAFFDNANQNLVFAFGDGGDASEGIGSMFLITPYIDFPDGEHTFVFACQASGSTLKGKLWVDNVVINERSKTDNQPIVSGSDTGGYGVVGNANRAGLITSTLVNASLVSNLSVYQSQLPATF